MQEFLRNLLIYVLFYEYCAFFCAYGIFHELCNRMRFEVDCAKWHHHVISEGLHSRSWKSSCFSIITSSYKEPRVLVWCTSFLCFFCLVNSCINPPCFWMEAVSSCFSSLKQLLMHGLLISSSSTPIYGTG